MAAQMKTTIGPHHLLAPVIAALFALLSGLLFLGYGAHTADGAPVLPLDDSYIHLQYAEQAAHGHFFQYNTGGMGEIIEKSPDGKKKMVRKTKRVPINTIAAMTFAIGSALAAAAGILFGVAYPVLDPYMGIVFGWKAFVAAILGGRGSVLGATLAGFLLGFIEIFVAMIFPSTLRDLIAYSIILIILTFRPHGFFGEPHSAQLRL